MSAGADVNFVSNDGESPVYVLLKIHDSTLVDAVLRLFIKNGADPNKGKEVPLVLAAQQKRQKSLKMLLEAGADVDKSNLNGDTALIASLRAFSKCTDGMYNGIPSQFQIKIIVINLIIQSRNSFTIFSANLIKKFQTKQMQTRSTKYIQIRKK